MKSFPKKALWFSRIFGSLPLEYSYGTSGIETIKFSITGFISGLTSFLPQVAFSGITMFLAVTEKIEEYPLVSLDSVTKLTIIVYSITLQVTAAVVFLCFVWNYFRFVDICNTLYWVHCRLYNKAPEIKDRINAIVVSIATGIILITLTYLYNINHVETLTSKMSSSPAILLYFTQVGLYVHFTYVTQSIASGFRMVSTSVKEETTRNIIEQMFVNQIPPNDETVSLTRNIILKIERLKSFMNIYWLLCDTIHQANNFYTGPLTAMMVCSFIHVIIASYYFFLFVRSGDSLSIIVQGVWLLVHICYTVLLFNSSTDVTNSADEMGPMLCKLINKNMNSHIRKQLEAFLIQLPHHNARFSALGFFQIHNESLTTMAGAVTAYMVVLIQFQSDLGST